MKPFAYEEWKTTREIQADGPDRCRVKGCHAKLSDSGHATCGNHEIDRAAGRRTGRKVK